MRCPGQEGSPPSAVPLEGPPRGERDVQPDHHGFGPQRHQHGHRPLQEAGYFFGDNLIPPNPGNPLGYYEDRELNKLNTELIARMLFSRTLSRFPGLLHPVHRDYFSAWLAAPPVLLPRMSRPEQKERIRHFLQQTPFCFKDPRFNVTLPVWRPYLPTTTRFLVVFREPDPYGRQHPPICVEEVRSAAPGHAKVGLPPLGPELPAHPREVRRRRGLALRRLRFHRRTPLVTGDLGLHPGRDRPIGARSVGEAIEAEREVQPPERGPALLPGLRATPRAIGPRPREVGRSGQPTADRGIGVGRCAPGSGRAEQSIRGGDGPVRAGGSHSGPTPPATSGAARESPRSTATRSRSATRHDDRPHPD